MSVEVRPLPEDVEYRRWAEAIGTAFGEETTDADLAEWERLSERDRLLAAFDGESIVGGGGAFSFRLTVPGGEVGAAGVTAVGVLPSHRRRGILTALMRRQLNDVRERGEPVAILWASEGNIYQRFGYGLASVAAGIELERSRSAFRLPVEPQGAIRLLERDAAAELFPVVYEQVRRERAGFFSRTDVWWEVEVLSDPERHRRGAGRKFYALYERDGRPEAYAIYRYRHEWDQRGSKSVLEVREAVAASVPATLALWRYLFEIDLIHTIKADRLAADHPLLLLVAEPRRLGLTLSDALWLRVVDLPAALSARSYRGNGRLVLEVTDSFCPWNAGRWSLDADGRGRVRASTDSADVVVDITDLGAAYLGAFSFSDLAQAGRVLECSPGALERADAMFATGRAPWCPQVF